MALLPIRILPRAITIAAPISVSLSNGGILAAGEWLWATGTASAEGCPGGMAEFFTAMATPPGTFQRGGDDFDLVILFMAAFGDPPTGNAVFSSPEPGTYVGEYTDSGGNGRYTVTVVHTTHLLGEMYDITQGCSVTLPFEVTRVGD
jgi:hypothetical protein